jgi:hypothetical protein
MQTGRGEWPRERDITYVKGKVCMSERRGGGEKGEKRYIYRQEPYTGFVKERGAKKKE